MGWMYSLIRDEGKVKLCEICDMGTEYMYVPVSWFNLFRYPIMIIKDLLCQKRELGIIPSGEFLNEQISEIIGGYND
jgi:hypothetical protein